jgi:hypothetical protein
MNSRNRFTYRMIIVALRQEYFCCRFISVFLFLFLCGSNNILFSPIERWLRPLLKNRSYSLLFTIFLASFLLLFLGICTNDNITANAQSKTPSSSFYHTTLPTIQIISPHEGEQVSPGELAIHGISSDNEHTDCRVYADVNDITPMQNVSAAGDSGEEDDFSKWSFTYTPNYQLIKQGVNELTAKITCLNERNPNADAFHLMSASAAPLNPSPPLSKWHTVNVTAVAGAPSVSQALPPVSSTEGLVEEEDNEENDEEDNGIEEDIASEADSSSEEEITNDEQNDDDADEDNDEDDNSLSDISEGGSGDSFFSGDPFFD